MIRVKNRVNRLVNILMELVGGVKITKPSENEEKIYSKPPDVHAAIWLLEQAFGKPKQAVEIDNNAQEVRRIAKEKFEKMSNEELDEHLRKAVDF